MWLPLKYFRVEAGSLQHGAFPNTPPWQEKCRNRPLFFEKCPMEEPLFG